MPTPNSPTLAFILAVVNDLHRVVFVREQHRAFKVVGLHYACVVGEASESDCIVLCDGSESGQGEEGCESVGVVVEAV